MPTNLQNLETRKATILTELAALTSRADYSIDGQQVSNSAYRKSLLDELKLLNELIAMESAPFEYASEGF